MGYCSFLFIVAHTGENDKAADLVQRYGTVEAYFTEDDGIGRSGYVVEHWTKFAATPNGRACFAAHQAREANKKKNEGDGAAGAEPAEDSPEDVLAKELAGVYDEEDKADKRKAPARLALTDGKAAANPGAGDESAKTNVTYKGNEYTFDDDELERELMGIGPSLSGKGPAAGEETDVMAEVARKRKEKKEKKKDKKRRGKEGKEEDGGAGAQGEDDDTAGAKKRKTE